MNKMMELKKVATVLTVYGIETVIEAVDNKRTAKESCNSAYRLRY